jgi:hypothetical protein
MTLSIFKSKKGGAIGFFFFALFFLVFWIFVLAPWLSIVGTMSAEGTTGLERLFYLNLNFWVLIGYILFLMYGVYS